MHESPGRQKPAVSVPGVWLQASTVAALISTAVSCIVATRVEFSRAMGPDVELVRPAWADLNPPGPLSWAFASRIEAAGVHITVAPQNDYSKFILLGIVLPIIPLPLRQNDFAGQGDEFWFVMRIDAGAHSYRFDPSRVTLEFPGEQSLVPTGFHANDCDDRRRGGALRRADGPLSLDYVACFNLVFPLAPQRPARRDFSLRIEGLVVDDVAVEVPVLQFQPDTGWTVHVEGAV